MKSKIKSIEITSSNETFTIQEMEGGEDTLQLWREDGKGEILIKKDDIQELSEILISLT